MKSGRSRVAAGVAVLVSALALLVFVITMNRDPGDKVDPVANGQTPLPTNPVIDGPIGEAKPGFANVGGVYRPESDVTFADRSGSDTPKPVVDPGLSPGVSPDANPAVNSVAEALSSREHPERFSSFVQPTAFDRKKFQADPESYLNTVEPGRVYQSADPGPDVKVIAARSVLYQRLTQGEQTPLVVETVPDAPVTFTSFNLGHFENQLTSTTVRADANGEARALFTAGKGTIDQIQILASSPETSGEVKFVVNVKLPAIAQQ